MSLGFLDLLDVWLADGVEANSEAFTAAQVQFVVSQQHPTGGFCGRAGKPERYYTDFAIRLLALLAPDHPALSAAARYLETEAPFPTDVVDAFSMLNSARLLQKCGIALALDTTGLSAVIARQACAGGGFSRQDDDAISAYNTFIAGLCFDIMAEPFPLSACTAQAVLRMQRPDGGFSELPTEDAGQTNATAAAVAFLLMQDALDEQTSRAATRFLGGMQAADGGLSAHAAMRTGDLLSTFTGVLTLGALDGLETLDLPALARFLKASAITKGGFRACPADPEGDIEYTYYGVATLALLRSFLQRSA